MASTVLPNGIIIPEKFSRDWYNDLYHNWQELDNLLAGGGANDGTLTIQKNGATVGTFSANQATDETINIEVPDVNNGTLTIQQNGTTVDTFTANSSSDKTVNIQCVDLTSNQTVGGNKEFTGTTTAHDVIPSATETYNFGSPSYQWNNAYIKSLTINGVAAGDILTHNASEFVNLSSNQTIGGVKIFSSSPTGVGRDLYHFASNPYGKNTPPANTSYQYVWFIGNSASQGLTNNWYSSYLEQRVFTDGSAQGRWLIRDTSESTLGIELFVKGSDKQLRPQGNNITDLGSSTNKWKSFNGINPGALSLPSGTVAMDLIGDVSVVGTEKKLSKDITVTGFVYADVSFSSTSSNRFNLFNDTKKYGIWIPCDNGRIRQIMPISAGDRLEFNVLDDGSTINAIKLFACRGNV